MVLCRECAPTLFIDTPVYQLGAQMDSNYFTSAYMAHAALNRWLKLTAEGSRPGQCMECRTVYVGVIFAGHAASHLHRLLLAFFSFTGYSPYSPSKAALRSLSDTLSQEMNLYAAAYPRDRVSACTQYFPRRYLPRPTKPRIESNLASPRCSRKGDQGQTAETIATKSIQALESGQEIITTDFTHRIAETEHAGRKHPGGSGGRLGRLVHAAGLLAIVMIFVRSDFDRKVRAWGRDFGASGTKGDNSKHVSGVESFSFGCSQTNNCMKQAACDHNNNNIVGMRSWRCPCAILWYKTSKLYSVASVRW